MKKKIVYFIISAIILFVFIGACSNLKNDEKRPNFVIIYADDLGYNDLGCFGSKLIRTPNLDKMSDEGIRFTNFYAQTVCGPSRAALMTGSYPSRIAQWENKRTIHPGVHPNEIFIPELLKQKNYSTGCFGKWDMARHSQTDFIFELMPRQQGFDYFFGTPASNDSKVSLMKNEQVIEESADFSTLTKRYTDEALAFINENRKKPFFVYLAHTMPHVKIDASAQFKGKSIRGLYGDVVEELDWNIGRIFDELKILNLDKNTYVIFISDNGPWYLDNHPYLSKYRDKGGSHGGSSFPLRGHKTSTWEGGLRVPFIAWGPQILSGVTCNEIASTLDMMPTIAKLAGVDVPEDRIIDGENIQALMFGEKATFDKDRVFFYYQSWYLQAVRKGKWKLHIPSYKQEDWKIFNKVEDWIEFSEPVLYNLEKDIGETTNLASENPEIVSDLLKLIEKARDDIGSGQQKGAGIRSFD